MSGCSPSSMTGSTDAGPLQPQEEPASFPIQPSTLDLPVSEENSSARRLRRYHPPRRKMTSASSSGQAIQLTPLWEHVVRTRRFPSEIDTQATFIEISERLRDPEWEVRQHALRVLMDVLPTLNTDVVDKVMQPVVPELINNLGHPAPAVRKGALDALRVYLIHSPNRDVMIKNILHDGLNRPDAHNPFQTNVTTGVILSAPLLLFPSSNSPRPTTEVLKDVTIAFASRLVQVPHQEAALKSLVKIREAVGKEEFENYLADYDNMKKNIEVLSKIYNIKPSKKKQRRNQTDIMKADNECSLNKTHWDSDSDTSGIAEEEDETPNDGMPSTRVVLETEIKFNEETAITMTILEEKDDESDEGSHNDAKKAGDVFQDPFLDKRKTPRRVHFGGEIVKLRTPDSDETESIDITPKTRIPLPVSPVTKMPERIRRRPSSQPCSPYPEKRGSKRTSRSASSSPMKERYILNAQLSPTKSILTRTSSSLDVVISATEETKISKNISKEKKSNEAIVENESSRVISNSQVINETLKKEQIVLVQAVPLSVSNGEKLTKGNEKNRAKDGNNMTRSVSTAENSKSTSPKAEKIISERDIRADVVDSNKNFDVTEASPKEQTKDYATTELVSSEGKIFKDIFGDKIELEDECSNESKIIISAHDCAFGSPVNQYNTRINRLVGGDFVDDERDMRIPGLITEDRATARTNYSDGEDSDGEGRGHDEHGRRSTSEANGSVTCSSSEGEGKPQEPNWEELGLVGQEVLDDLHNKDDWRARVRALERVMSALRTSSALIAIESRLGSLLHAVLGGERSCRVAAAGLAVAKVVVAGVSEDALRKKLSQLAWGLARQGGPAAAQLTRIAMLRLKPSLLLEQLLQPHCLNARNAKTRENALQLLIFSLVTFPSTEFKLDIVANRVATMVADRRRRVRQAALDTLAVLAQIYDPEEVLEAGKRAAAGCADAEAILAAIRARLARKSLPLVSADGLVVYGLQISPTVQIATGPDVDWIVAGSGSVSPGTGRTRGQIIATSRSAQGRASRTGNTNNRENPWIERPNLVALGVALQSKADQSAIAWQILPSQSNDDNGNEIKGPNGRNVNAGVSSNLNLRSEEQLPLSYASSNPLYDFVGAKNQKEPPDNNLEQKVRNRKDVNETAKEKENTVIRGDSKIPVLSTRHKIAPQNREKSINLEYINSNARKQTKDILDNNRNRINSQESVGSYAAIYQRRKHLQQEEPSFVTSETSQVSNQTFDSHYRSSHTKAVGNREFSGIVESKETVFSDDNSHSYDRFVNNDKYTDKKDSSDYNGGRQRSFFKNMQQQQTLVETYGSIHERQRNVFVDRNTYRQLRTAPNPLTRAYHEFQNLDSQVAANSDKDAIFRPTNLRTKDAIARQRTGTDSVSSDSQENGHSFSESFNDSRGRRRLRSLSPSQLRRSRQFVKLTANRSQAASMYDIDKATVNEEEYNARNKHHFSSEATNYRVQNSNREESRHQVDERAREHIKSASSSSSDVSRRNDRQGGKNQDVTLREYSDDNSRSSTPQSRNAEPAFDIITQQTTNRQGRDDVDSFFTSANSSNKTKTTNALIKDEGSKEWSSEDDAKPVNRIRPISRLSEHGQPIVTDENCNRSTGSSSSCHEAEDRSNARRRSIVSVIANESCASPKKSEYQSPNYNTHNSSLSNSPSKRNSGCNSRNLPFEHQTEETRNFGEERLVASAVPEENASVRTLDANRNPMDIGATDSPAIIIASRPHSQEYAENSRSVEDANSRGRNIAQESTEEESSVNDTLDDRQSKDSASETNTEPGILKIEPEPVEPIETRRRMPSKVPRGRYRGILSKKATDKPSEKSKRTVQQCLSQLENKDWEITMKGLKALSQIAKQYPEYLDLCPTGTIGRLLGRHIKNLRSQVARAACLAAGDVFSSQIRGIEQDLDEIAGPLLHRTADTNRFLRADSNAALDQMMQYLPPHKTVGIIVLRGASHQNAIVRAATARLLSDVTEQIGPEHIMILPRDVKDKLLNTGAKLLMDGNLDARNHAKRMFRRLTRTEGFRKALTDAVPETILRHIDKTMKTL